MKQWHKVLIMGLLLGTSFPVSKFSIAALGVWPFRLISSFSALLGLAIFFRQEVGSFFLQKINLPDVMKLAILAVPNIFLVPTLNNFALSRTSASNALILVYMMPAMLSVIKMVADRKIRTDSIIASLLSVSGIILLLKSATVGTGEVLILLSATVWAFGTYFAGRVVTQFPASITTIVQFFTSFILVVLCFMFSPDQMKSVLHTPKVATLLWPVILAIYVGFIANAIVFYLWFALIPEKGAEFVAYSSLISLLVGILTSIWLLGEPASAILLVSLLLILSSVYIVQCRKQAVQTSVQAVPAPLQNEGGA